MGMILRDRCDGKRVRDKTRYGIIMPYLMTSRNESVVFFARDIEIDAALAYVKRKNAELGENVYSLFGLFLAAGLRTLVLKPRLNRFVHRRGMYSHNDIRFSFIVKRRLTEEAAEANAKIRFEPEDCLDKVMERFNAAVEKAKGEENTPEGLEIDAWSKLPGGKAFITGLFRILDRFNLAPAAMIENDPLFTSVYFANLGSIGLETPYHHLYEWGSASLFVVLGRSFLKEVPRQGGAPALRHFINVKISVDERIADGIYLAHAASLFNRFILHPELMELAPEVQ